MAIVTTDNKHYQNIANAIRDTGVYEGPIPPGQMAELIAEISASSKHAEYEAFWRNVLNCSIDAYGYRFAGRGWNDNTFKPPFDIRPIGTAHNMFNGCAISDLANILRECGVQFDISGCTGRVDSMFPYASLLTTVPLLDVRNSTRAGSEELNAMFDSCSNLHTIEGIHLKEDGTTGWGNRTFYGCTALKNLTIYGAIGKNGLNVSWSVRLSHSSLMSIINALQDKTGDTSAAWVVTLGATNLEKLTDAEKAMATQKGWTLA